MVTIKHVRLDEAINKLIVDVEEFPENSWIFDMSLISGINDFKDKLLAKEQEMEKQKQLVQDIQTLIDNKTEIKL